MEWVQMSAGSLKRNGEREGAEEDGKFRQVFIEKMSLGGGGFLIPSSTNSFPTKV